MTAAPANSATTRLETTPRQMLDRPATRLHSQPRPVDTARSISDYRREKQGCLNVGIASVATAVPRHKISQQEATERARRIFPHLASRDSLYANTGIDTRYACEPADWYHERRGWEERTTAFSKHAVDLLEDVALKATKAAGLELRDIDAIVVNTITGVAVPSLDALLMNRLDFREDVERLPIFGFGCGGGVAGLSRAAELACARPGTNVLFLSVDLCSLCLRVQDDSLAMFVATALFGDGAAGACLDAGRVRTTAPFRHALRSLLPANISGVGLSTSWAGTLKAMAWASSSVPS